MALTASAVAAPGSHPNWLIALEAAHDCLIEFGQLLEVQPELPVDPEQLGSAIKTLFAWLYHAMNEVSDPLDATGHVLEATRATRGLLASGVSDNAAIGFAMQLLDQSTTYTQRAEQLLSLQQWSPPPLPNRVTASPGLPKAHLLRRDPVVPQTDLVGAPEASIAPPLPALEPPQTFEELEARIKELKERNRPKVPEPGAEPKPSLDAPEPERAPQSPEGFSPDPLPAPTELELIQQRTRECFEDVVALCTQRDPIAAEPWQSVEFLEQRLLANVDSIAALGGAAITHIGELVRWAPVKDPALLKGVTFLAGCLEGRDTLAIAERLLVANQGRSPDFAEEFAAALCLAPNSHCQLMLRYWLRSPNPERRALAIRVLATRGEASMGELEAGVRDEARVTSRCLPWLAIQLHPQVREFCDDALLIDDAELQRSAWLAMVLSHQQRALPALAAALDGENAEEAAVLMAVAGERGDAEYLLTRARETPTVALVHALGWAGLIDAIEFLIALLGVEDEEVQLAASKALERITAANLMEEVPLPPEESMEPDVSSPSTGEPEPSLGREISSPRDAPDEGSPATIELPSKDQQLWRAYWLENHPRFDPSKRYRIGQPYSPLVLVDELTHSIRSPRERQLIHTELIVRTGEYLPFSPRDFVVKQRSSIEAWRLVAERRSSSPGSFVRPMRRSHQGPGVA